jgi:hypothetical protein
LQRGSAILAVIATSLVFATADWRPPPPWKKAAPFPEPDEELYCVAVNGKMYVIGGWGQAAGLSPCSSSGKRWIIAVVRSSFMATQPRCNETALVNIAPLVSTHPSQKYRARRTDNYTNS